MHQRVALGITRTRCRDLIDHARHLGVTELDLPAVGYNGNAHHVIAADAGDLIDDFALTVRLSPRPSLPPLVEQARHAVDALGTQPAMMLVNNPEHVLSGLAVRHAVRWWHDLTAVMSNLVTNELCAAWGVASWNPQPLAAIVDAGDHVDHPATVLAGRSGLHVPGDTTAASETVMQRLRLPTDARWGTITTPANTVLLAGDDPHQFLNPDAPACSPIAAAVAASWRSPEASRMTVIADEPAQLTHMVDAADIPVDGDHVALYRGRMTLHQHAAVALA